MVFFSLAAKVVVWTVFWTIRALPAVGARLSDAYGDRVLTPVAEDIVVEGIAADWTDDDPRSTEVRFEIANDSWVDVTVSGLDVRVGLSEVGATLRHVTWAPAFDNPPTNVRVPRIDSGSGDAIRAEFYEPTIDEGETTLHVDGSFVFSYSFLVRGRRFAFVDRSYDLPSATVEV